MFQTGDRVRFREGATVPFRIRADAQLVIRQVSSVGPVRISIGHGSVWVNRELLEPVEPLTAQPEE